MTKLAALLAIATTAAACGDNLKPGDTGQPDSGTDAPPPAPRAVIVSGDFTPGHPGVMTALDPATREIMTNVAPAGAIGDDPVLRHAGTELLVVNRNDGNNITILDDQTFQLVDQLATGAGSNPQDVAVLGDKLFVATFSKKGGLMLTRGSTVVTEIDLSADDPDGEPNCSSVYYAFNKLYFACGLLDDTMMFKPPRGPGKVYVVNPTTLHVDQTITMTTNNPIALFEQIPPSAPHGNDLLMPTIDFGTGAGCIERITPSDAAGCMIDNSMLGGFAYAERLAFSGTRARVGAADYPKGNVLDLDLATGMVAAQPMTPTSQVVGDLVVCPAGQMVVTDTTMATNGLRVYEGTAETTTAALPIGLKPASSHGLVCY